MRELEELLEGRRETQSFEVKASMAWDERKLAKDILAMSNVQDGGRIVIGVEDGTFARTGVTPSDRDSYKLDEMRDQMAKFADPHVDFHVEVLTDLNGVEYVVIDVASFREVPVICRKDSVDTTEGAIYYRNTNRRVQSAAVSNSYDMRDIVTVATTRMSERFRRLGMDITSPADATRARLDEELGDL